MSDRAGEPLSSTAPPGGGGTPGPGRSNATPPASSLPSAVLATRPAGQAPASVFANLQAVAERHPAAQVVPLAFDFDHDPDPPAYVVDRLFERQTVNILSGDTGAGKSLICAALVVAICSGHGEWLGRETYAERVLVVDEENPARFVRERLRALGLRNEHGARLRYFSRQGFLIGEPKWTDLLRAQAEEHGADLIIIDTASAATSPEVNDNSEVARLYSQALRPIATDLNAAVLVLHHERKPQAGQTRDPGQAMLGARQWAGQADTHVSIRVRDRLEEEQGSNGLRELRREFVMQTPKVRDGEPDIARIVVVSSEKDDRGSLISMSITDGGRHKPEPSKQNVLAERIETVLREQGATKRSDLRKALDVDDGGTFTRALEHAEATGSIRKLTNGTYVPATAEEPI